MYKLSTVRQTYLVLSLSSLVFQEDCTVICVPSEPSVLFCELVQDNLRQSLVLEQLVA